MLIDQLSKMGNSFLCPGAVIVRDQKILMGLRHYTKDKWKDISVWTIPGGRCDDVENVETTLRREVLEEIGMTDFEICDFIDEVSGAKEGDVVPLFFCTTAQEPQLMEPEKFSQWEWVSIDECRSGNMRDFINPLALEKILYFLEVSGLIDEPLL